MNTVEREAIAATYYELVDAPTRPPLPPDVRDAIARMLIGALERVARD